MCFCKRCIHPLVRIFCLFVRDVLTSKLISLFHNTETANREVEEEEEARPMPLWPMHLHHRTPLAMIDMEEAVDAAAATMIIIPVEATIAQHHPLNTKAVDVVEVEEEDEGEAGVVDVVEAGAIVFDDATREVRVAAAIVTTATAITPTAMTRVDRIDIPLLPSMTVQPPSIHQNHPRQKASTVDTKVEKFHCRRPRHHRQLPDQETMSDRQEMT